MIRKLLELFRRRRRVSTHLTPAYERRRIRELRKARENFMRGMAA